MLRLENRGKLAGLPKDLMEVRNGFTFPSRGLGRRSA